MPAHISQQSYGPENIRIDHQPNHIGDQTLFVRVASRELGIALRGATLERRRRYVHQRRWCHNRPIIQHLRCQIADVSLAGGGCFAGKPHLSVGADQSSQMALHFDLLGAEQAGFVSRIGGLKRHHITIPAINF